MAGYAPGMALMTLAGDAALAGAEERVQVGGGLAQVRLVSPRWGEDQAVELLKVAGRAPMIAVAALDAALMCHGCCLGVR